MCDASMLASRQQSLGPGQQPSSECGMPVHAEHICAARCESDALDVIQPATGGRVAAQLEWPDACSRRDRHTQLVQVEIALSHPSKLNIRTQT